MTTSSSCRYSSQLPSSPPTRPTHPGLSSADAFAFVRRPPSFPRSAPPIAWPSCSSPTTFSSARYFSSSSDYHQQSSPQQNEIKLSTSSKPTVASPAPVSPPTPSFVARYLPGPIFQPLHSTYLAFGSTKIYLANGVNRTVELVVPKTVVLLYRRTMDSIWAFFRIESMEQEPEQKVTSPYWRLWEMAKPEKLRLGLGILVSMARSFTSV